MAKRTRGESVAGSRSVSQDRALRVVAVIGAALAVIATVVMTPNFLTIDNMVAIFRNASVVGIVAVAMTPVTLSGNFVSLAIAQTAMAAMVGFVALIGWGWSQPVAMIAVIVSTVAVGGIQGAVIAAGLNPIITTLAAGAIIFGAVSKATGGGIVRLGDIPISWGGKGIAGMPLEVIVFVLFTLIVALLMSKTVIGRETALVGANRAAAEISGISFARVAISTFGIFSVGLGIAGILSGAAFGQATANSFAGLTINVVAAVLVGGTAIQGGAGSPLRSAVGAVVIAIISNAMILNDFSTGGRLAVQGGVVVAIVVLLDIQRRRRGKRT